MDESDYVWRPAFLDEIQNGDVVQSHDSEPAWTVTGTRYEPTSGMCSIIGVDGQGRPQGRIAEGYRPVLRREYAIPQVPVAPQPPSAVEQAQHQAEWFGLSSHVAGAHGRPDLVSSSISSMAASHEELPHGTDEIPHTHRVVETVASRLLVADLETEIPSPPADVEGNPLPSDYEPLELPHLVGEPLLAHLRADIAPGDSTLPGHEFGDFDLAEVIGQHGSLEGRHDHDHLHNQSVELPHRHAPAVRYVPSDQTDDGLITAPAAAATDDTVEVRT